MINIEVLYSNHNKTFKFILDGKTYDISSEVPEEVWNIGKRIYPINPIDDWKTRKELRKIFIKYFRKNIDKNLNGNDIIF